MNVNGISNQTSTYAAYKSTEQKAAATETEGKQTEASAVYEPSKDAKRQILLQQSRKMKQLSAGSRQMQRRVHSSFSSLYSR